MDIIRESYLSRIRPFYDTDYIKAITGIRRCGKSVLMGQIKDELLARGIKEDHIISYNLEGESGEGITTRKKLEKRLHKDIKDKSKYYIFIDEVQHIKKFEIAIASVRVSFNCSLFVTGSNSKIIKGKLSDRLTGRAKEFPMFPFTYGEAVEYKKLNGIQIEDPYSDFIDFLKWGGMPQRYLEVDEQGETEYHRSLYESIIEKDVYKNHKRIARAAFRNVADYAMASSGRQFSPTSVARHLKSGLSDKALSIEARTISNYKRYLEECFLLLPCKPYFVSGKKALDGSSTSYCPTNGIRTALGNTIDTDASFGLENVVYQELIKRGYEVRTGRTRGGSIDFVAIKGHKKCFIQVAYLLSDERTVDREYGAYDKVRDASPKYVFSLDRIDTSKNGITHLYIVDFLLGKADITLL